MRGEGPCVTVKPRFVKNEVSEAFCPGVGRYGRRVVELRKLP
jgi:hypothetical protein